MKSFRVIALIAQISSGDAIINFLQLGVVCIVPGRVAPGDCFPGAPADPYVPFQAYGSSYHELATGRLSE